MTPANLPESKSRAKALTFSVGRAIFRHTLVVLVAMVSIAARTTTPPQKDCFQLLEEVQATVGPIKGENFWLKDLSKEPTVAVTSSHPGRHGGLRLLLRRTGPAWISKHSTPSPSTDGIKREYDPQGDPNWFVDVMGTKAAKFFGFEIIDDHHMMIPNPAEFKAALVKINAALVAAKQPPIPIAFYATEDSENVKV